MSIAPTAAYLSSSSVGAACFFGSCKLQRSRNVHCDHELARSSPSPPLEERGGERRPFIEGPIEPG